MTPTSNDLLRSSFAALRAEGLRARDAAARMGLSEGAAVAAHAVSPTQPAHPADSLLHAIVLDADWLGLLRGLEQVGEVMALTRNEHIVHEKIGVYRHASAQGPVGLLVGPEIDLRLFFSHWHVGFHVAESTPRGVQHSLQFFDRYGGAVHKVHARPQTDLDAWHALAARHRSPLPSPAFDPGEPVRTADRPDAEIDALGLGEAWASMHDTHEFFDLLKRFQVGRLQALRLMEGVHTRRAPADATARLLAQARDASVPIMVFVGSRGCIQIHTGPVHRVEPMGPWLNVLDDGFNLHLREDAIHETWLVSKPTDDGPVTSIEVFDRHGDVIVMFFGARKPGQPERPDWRALAFGLTSAAEREAA